MREITRRGMTGEMPFADSLNARARAMGERMTLAEMEDICGNVKPRGGLGYALDVLTREGYDLAVVSGGIYPLVEAFTQSNGIQADYMAASGITRLAGRISGVMPLTDKREVVNHFRNIGYQYIAAMGDGANDRSMKAAADLFVWIEPKPGMVETGDMVLSGNDLSLLPDILLNYRRK
ncbi:MAG: haloacid dehalogenase-like hydrolase [Candidatus Aenigmarchaeota archaeon]|nr:haloacid dehalogenase-like hydrolase [Candidatus Aenigmarchaeota archaeon]